MTRSRSSMAPCMSASCTRPASCTTSGCVASASANGSLRIHDAARASNATRQTTRQTIHAFNRKSLHMRFAMAAVTAIAANAATTASACSRPRSSMGCTAAWSSARFSTARRPRITMIARVAARPPRQSSITTITATARMPLSSVAFESWSSTTEDHACATAPASAIAPISHRLWGAFAFGTCQEGCSGRVVEVIFSVRSNDRDIATPRNGMFERFRNHQNFRGGVKWKKIFHYFDLNRHERLQCSSSMQLAAPGATGWWPCGLPRLPVITPDCAATSVLPSGRWRSFRMTLEVKLDRQNFRRQNCWHRRHTETRRSRWRRDRATR